MTKLIILRGYPGSGKTTIGKQLQASKLGEFIDHNAILTFLADIVGNDDGIYDEIAQLELAMCKKLLTEGKSVIVARGFSSLSSIEAYTRVARELHINTIILRLEVGESELFRRVQSPERQLGFNPTIDTSHALSWMANNPLESHPDEIVIDNEKPIYEVVQNITAALELG
jgi:shikimate kinase